MSFEMKVILATTICVGIFLVAAVMWRLPKRLKPKRFTAKWQDLQQLCRDKSTWGEAVVKADKLLDEALKRRKVKGRSTGERLVSASKRFSNNDAVWFAHNLCKKVLTDPDARLKEDDVKKALASFRQALRDLGALPSPQQLEEPKKD